MDQPCNYLKDNLEINPGNNLRGIFGSFLVGQLREQLNKRFCGYIDDSLKRQFEDQFRNQLCDRLNGQLCGKLWKQLWERFEG